jgi:thiamine kinase-like enzyme
VRDPRDFLAQLWDGIDADFALPNFVRVAVGRVLAEDPPICDRSMVLGHNDLNPTNLVYDGDKILVLDWATAGPMDPFYDLAVLAVFLRMDEDACLRMFSAYEDERGIDLPNRFRYLRRLAAALAGTMQLSLARLMKHTGATGAETLASAMSLSEFYRGLRAGALQVGTADAQWAFGLALLKESLSL